MKPTDNSETLGDDKPDALTKGGAGCLSLVSLPFLALGVGMLIFAFTLYQKGHENAAGAAGFGVIALGIGIVLLVLIRMLFRHGQRVRQRVAESPDEPWLWKPQWASGTISDSGTSSAAFFWCFALFWNAVSWPVAIFVALPDFLKGDYLVSFVFLFPLIGIGMLWAAIYMTVRHLKFGKSTLELETIPGAIGGWIAGSIETAVPIVGDTGVRLTLRCVNRVTTGSGKNRSTSERQLWQDEQLLTGRLPSSKIGGSSIPIAFRIPPDCTPTRDGSNNEIVWRLRAHAAMSGADYQSDFVVPVFAVAQMDGLIPRSDPLAAKLRSAEFTAAQTSPDLDVVTDAAGRMRFHFPASQRRRAAITVSVFLLVFATITFVIFAVDAPRLFGVLSGGVAAILLYASIVLWFRDVELHVDRHGVQRFRRTLGFSTTYTIPASEAGAVRYRETAQVNGNSYYTVSIDTSEGKVVNLISGLLQRDAKALADRIGNALGVRSGMEKDEVRR